MNVMIKKLLQGQAVEWRALGEVVSTITAPTKVKKEVYKISGKIPIIDQGIEFIAGYTDEPLTPVKSDQYVIFGDHSEHIKFVDFAFIQGADGLKILKPKYDNAKYIYHAFLNFYKKELSYKRHWAKAKETLIPIPPLSVQSHIVQILDTFTELTAELTTELSMRQKQYQYYQDLLLSEHELAKVGFEWKRLGEVAKIKHGKDWKKLAIGDIPVYGSGGIMGYVDTFSYDKPSVLIPRKGSITNLFYVETPFWNVDTIYYTQIDTSQILPKFLYYFIKTIDLMQLDTGSGRPSLTQAILNKIQIPIPPLSIQSHIVQILDTFDTLVNSISEGLPKEIQLRQKQYEYYRELLLGFPMI
ncbi:restriction endonuclease subunit S [Moraxella catarrhalis]|uniref:restriction endonuclease subunit S n=1 Tax=Moraxella catarrhalis TaxID=480 RepID=UPI000DFCE7B0|nr:restriction endonuclease subunit S [Moraxella catarrhalis]STY80011.1 Type I restriction enzyme specificity protein MPN_089 [Moraxella catarrhalis]